VRGLTPASPVDDPGWSRPEGAGIRPARLVEDPELGWHPVGAPESWPDPLAFLDGVQRSELVAYAGAVPLFLGEVAAAIRERCDRRLTTVVEARRVLLLGRPEALAKVGDALPGLDTVALASEEPSHPARDLLNAGRALDRTRAALKLTLRDQYRRGSDGWLIVDGALSDSPVWAADRRMVAVSKSHATLPFDGANLERFLRVPPAHRTSVYVPESRTLAPVRQWALRLWPWEGKDVFHGLVRIEVAPENGMPESADAISRRILAERAPISTPDQRWHRQLYGIHSVESYLRAGSRSRG
jgi:hypothetical protein